MRAMFVGQWTSRRQHTVGCVLATTRWCTFAAIFYFIFFHVTVVVGKSPLLKKNCCSFSRLFCLRRVIHPRQCICCGFCDQKHTARITEHEMSGEHRKYTLSLMHCTKLMGTIDAPLGRQIELESLYWKNVLRQLRWLHFWARGVFLCREMTNI